MLSLWVSQRQELFQVVNPLPGVNSFRPQTMRVLQILAAISISPIATSVQTANRLIPPSVHGPSQASPWAFLSSSTSPSNPQPNPDSSPPFYAPSKQLALGNWKPPSFPLDTQQQSDLVLISYKLNPSIDPMDFTEDEQMDTFKEPESRRVARNHHQHQHPNQDQLGHHFDVCVVSYDLKDLGSEVYPRYIQTANCRNQLPPNLQDHIICKPIHYNVQVLTQRKSTDPEDGYRNSLPEELKDWRFVHVPVNVGCHCTVTNFP